MCGKINEDDDDAISCDECKAVICCECCQPIFADICALCQLKAFEKFQQKTQYATGLTAKTTGDTVGGTPMSTTSLCFDGLCNVWSWCKRSAQNFFTTSIVAKVESQEAELIAMMLSTADGEASVEERIWHAAEDRFTNPEPSVSGGREETSAPIERE